MSGKVWGLKEAVDDDDEGSKIVIIEENIEVDGGMEGLVLGKQVQEEVEKKRELVDR